MKQYELWKNVVKIGCILAVCPGLLAKQKIRVGVEALDYSPYYHFIQGKEDQATGFISELFKLFNLTSEQYQVVLEAYPIVRLQHQFFMHAIEAKFPDHPNWNVKEKQGYDITYSEPVVIFQDGLLMLEEKLTLPINVIGMIYGFTPVFYDSSSPRLQNFHLQTTSSLDALIKMLYSKRVDAVYGNVAVAQFLGKNIGMEVYFDRDLPFVEAYYHLSVLKEKDFLVAFNQFLQEQQSVLDVFKKQYKIM